MEGSLDKRRTEAATWFCGRGAAASGVLRSRFLHSSRADKQPHASNPS